MAGSIFCLLSILCIITNTVFDFKGLSIILYIDNYKYVMGGTLIMLCISLFMFFAASICNCDEEIFKNHLKKY